MDKLNVNKDLLRAIIDDQKIKNRTINLAEEFENFTYQQKKGCAQRAGLSDKDFALIKKLLVES